MLRSLLEQLKRLIVAVVFERFDAAKDQRFRFGELLTEIEQAANFSQFLLRGLLVAGGAQRDAEIVARLFEIGFEGDGSLEGIDCGRVVTRGFLRQAQVIPSLRIGAVAFHRRLEFSQRTLLLTQAAQRDTEPLVRLGVIGPDS